MWKIFFHHNKITSTDCMFQKPHLYQEVLDIDEHMVLIKRRRKERSGNTEVTELSMEREERSERSGEMREKELMDFLSK